MNHFSFIIFYNSVWLGFELFRLRVQTYSQLVQFTLARKGYDNHNCHNKPPDRKCGGEWMTLCTEEMVLRIWGFWKRVSWRFTLDHACRHLSFCHTVKSWRCSWVFRISTDRYLKHHKMHRALVGSDTMFSIVRIVSLSSCRRTEVRY